MPKHRDLMAPVDVNDVKLESPAPQGSGPGNTDVPAGDQMTIPGVPQIDVEPRGLTATLEGQRFQLRGEGGGTYFLSDWFDTKGRVGLIPEQKFDVDFRIVQGGKKTAWQRIGTFSTPAARGLTKMGKE